MIPNGRLLKEKLEYFREKFRTKEGLFDFFIGTAIWGFLIVTYTKLIFEAIRSFYSFIPFKFLQLYLAYLTFGVFLVPIGIGVSYITVYLFKFLRRVKRELFGGR